MTAAAVAETETAIINEMMPRHWCPLRDDSSLLDDDDTSKICAGLVGVK